MSARAPLAAVLLLAAVPAVAGAAWTPGPEIASVDNVRREQADGATQFADISGDGRYVVFQTAATNFYPDGDTDAPGTLRAGGIFRYDRQGGGISLVSDGDVVADPGGQVQVRGGANPSVGDDGRFVAFSTAQRLTPLDTNDNIDVYVRDMDVPVGADRAGSGAYELVSALDLTAVPPNYEPRDPPLPGRTPGANLWPGQAISADGRYVAFRTVEQRSDLAGTGPLQTPPGTVFVRDLRENRTTVVSRARADGSPVGFSEAPIVLSADGTTVSWVGNGAPSQTRFLPGESADDQRPYYLWRRWADLGATTRRVTGQVDVDDPGCPPGGQIDGSDGTTQGPCYGPLTTFEQGTNSITTRAPALSGDGYAVAFLVGAGLRPNVNQADGLDLFRTDMRPGVSRKAGTRQVTVDAIAGNPRASGEIESIAMSRDGQRIAAITGRSAFLLPRPAFLGTPRSEPLAEPLMFDLGEESIERIALTPSGGAIDGVAQGNLSMTADGRAVAFTSAAANILPGDSNEAADAFVARFRPPSGPPGAPPRITQPALRGPAAVAAKPKLTVSATRRADGSVAVKVKSPLAGRLTATASTRARPKPAGRKAPKSSAKARRVASLARTLNKAGTVTLVLRIAGADGRRIKAGASLTVPVVLKLVPAGSAAVSARKTVTFRGTPKKKKTAKK